MEKDTTTEGVSEPNATTETEEVSQVEQSDVASAEQTQTEPTADKVSGKAENAEVVEDTSNEQLAEDIEAWAKKKNLPLDDPIKLAKMYRDAEKQMHDKSVQASQLEKTLEQGAYNDYFNSQDPNELAYLATEVKAIKASQQVNKFFEQNPDAINYEQKMTDLVMERPYLANDLEALYALAKSKDLDTNAESLKSQGGQEALTRLAQKQASASTRGSAIKGNIDSSSVLTPENVDEKVAQMSPEEYLSRRDEIMRVSGLK